jgi:hypothetical protein
MATSLHGHGVVRRSACMAPGTGMIHGEPKLDELLHEPVVLALVRSDGITVDDVIRAFETARRALKGLQRKPS